MTHPLTPSEKVAKEIVDRTGVGTLGLTYEASQSVALGIADAILTALASGSGDHAELALNAKAAQTWALGIYENREQAERRSKFIDSDLPATVLALLAENAALRESISRHDRQVSGMLRARLAAENRATEAERKLAEAVGRLERWEPKPFCPPSVSSGTSKEAERG